MRSRTRIEIGVYGTTSSGKSTLLNLLIGHNLLPTAVQEMTTTETVITDHPRRRQLTVSWPNQAPGLDLAPRTAMEVTEQLTHQFANLAHGQPAPRLDVVWPTRLGRQVAKARVDLTLVDHPGVRFIGDEDNQVGSHCPDIVVVVLGADETDIRRQLFLLQQIRRLVPDPQRQLLLVLNKIDALLSDSDPVWSEEQLRHTLHRAMVTDWPELGSLQLHSISARSAQHAHIALERKTIWQTLWAMFFGSPAPAADPVEALLTHHTRMIPPEILDELPRNTQQLTKQQRFQVARTILTASRSDAFEAKLIDMIHQAAGV